MLYAPEGKANLSMCSSYLKIFGMRVDAESISDMPRRTAAFKGLVMDGLEFSLVI